MDYDSLQVAGRLEHLSEAALLAFGLSVAERLYPNFVRFSRDFGYGHESVLRQAIDRCWAYLAGEGEAVGLRALAQECEEISPDTGDFDTILVSSALDAANVTALYLRLTFDPAPDVAVEISSLARDTVDMYVQELEGMTERGAALEERIRLHPLMQAELKRQDDDLGFLSGEWTVSDVKVRWLGRPSSLGFL